VHAEDQKTVNEAGDLEKGSRGGAAEVDENEATIGAVPICGKSASSPDESKDGSKKENSC
jgi:hypothetical protein